MDLIDRYLNAVRFWLPKAQRQDIISELAEDIRSQVEDRELSLGRPLEENDVSALLRKRGSPFSVAGKYFPQRHLIGPSLYPIYIFVLKLAAAIYTLPWLAVWAGLVLFVPSYRDAHPGFALFETLGSLATTIVFAFAAITLGFAVAERSQRRSSDRNEWDPRRLPKVRDVLKIPRASSLAAIIVDLVFLAWWFAGFGPSFLFSHDGVPIQVSAGPVWADFHSRFLVLVAALILAGAALSGFNFFRPFWTRLRLGIRAAIDGAAAGVIFSVLGVHGAELGSALETLKRASSGIAKAGRIQAWIDLTVAATLGIIAIVSLAETIQSVVRIVRWDSLRARTKTGRRG
jgi:hypothetical protein